MLAVSVKPATGTSTHRPNAQRRNEAIPPRPTTGPLRARPSVPPPAAGLLCDRARIETFPEFKFCTDCRHHGMGPVQAEVAAQSIDHFDSRAVRAE